MAKTMTGISGGLRAATTCRASGAATALLIAPSDMDRTRCVRQPHSDEQQKPIIAD
jgi:hypothetical protein